MLKYLTHKLRSQSISEENQQTNDKIDGHDSGTESDGDLEEDEFNQEMDLSMNSRQDTSPTDSTLCSSESPIFVGGPAATLDLSNMYDQHSSEEELEVINGPLSESPTNVLRTPPSIKHNQYQPYLGSAFVASGGSSSGGSGSSNSNNGVDTNTSPKRCCSSTLLEKRKRSLAHSSDDEVRHLLEQQNNNNLLPQPHLLAPVNFRTSPPLEALKPHRSHLVQRPTTPLVLAERGIENIRISAGNAGAVNSAAGVTNSTKCDSPTSIVQQQHHLGATSAGAVHHHHHHLHHNQFDQNRSISPPAKVFHCAVSPTRRRQSRHQTQRLQRPHRPCLDFDKMQQLKARSIASWRHGNDHSGGELSVFCW